MILAMQQSLVVVVTAMGFLWLISLIRRDASVADLFWGSGFVLVAGTVFASHAAAQSIWRCWLIGSLTLIWGLRLSTHLIRRNWGHGEDRRYQAMRNHHGPRFWWVSLFTVFLLQGVLLWLVSMPIVATMTQASTRPLGVWDGLGSLVWSFGLFFEAVGDYQLDRFLKAPENAGRVMDRGLWRYTRHPNYFGDFCIWWGIYLIAVGGGVAWTIFSPLVMTFLLLKVSGVGLLEQTIVSRRPGYADYQARTSAFFPRRPR